MRAFVCSVNGPPSLLSLQDLEGPALGPSHVRIQTHYVGVNFADVMAVAGTHQFPPPMPFSPGFEASGIVADVGEAVHHVSAGDQVVFSAGHGAYREEIVADQVNVHRVPARLSLAQAAAFPVAFGTAYLALTRRAAIRHGSDLLVVGAAGNIGSAALQVGKLLGARTLAIVRGRSIGRALGLGADLAIDYETEDIAERIMSATDGRGVDVVFDPVIGSHFETIKGCVAAEGAYLIMGFAGGDLNAPPTFSVLEPLQRNIAFLSADYDYYLHADLSAVRTCFDVLFRWMERGWIEPLKPVVRPFEDAVSVLADIGEKTTGGKQVLRTRFASDVEVMA